MKLIELARIALVLGVCIVALSGTAARADGCPNREALRLVDKRHSLRWDDAPRDLIALPALGAPTYANLPLQMRYDAAEAFARMAAAVAAQRHALLAISTYRSYWDQRYVFSQAVLRELSAYQDAGEPIDEPTATAYANRYSAQPGQSEHQLGTVVDVSTRELQGALSASLPATEAGKWLMAHAHEFGFVVSYPSGKERLTGYNAEPWHLRWVGDDIAHELFAQHYLDPQNTLTLAGYLTSKDWSACVAPLTP